MRRLLLAAACLATSTYVEAAIPGDVAIDSGTTGAGLDIRVFETLDGACCGDAGFLRFGLPTTPEGRC